MKFGKEDGGRVQEIEASIAEHAEKAGELDRRWAQECELVAEIVETRRQLMDVTKENSGETPEQSVDVLQSRLRAGKIVARNTSRAAFGAS